MCVHVFVCVHACIILLLFAGIVTLETSYDVCKAGDKLTPEQAKILVSFI